MHKRACEQWYNGGNSKFFSICGSKVSIVSLWKRWQDHVLQACSLSFFRSSIITTLCSCHQPPWVVNKGKTFSSPLSIFRLFPFFSTQAWLDSSHLPWPCWEWSIRDTRQRQALSSTGAIVQCGREPRKRGPPPGRGASSRGNDGDEPLKVTVILPGGKEAREIPGRWVSDLCSEKNELSDASRPWGEWRWRAKERKETEEVGRAQTTEPRMPCQGVWTLSHGQWGNH